MRRSDNSQQQPVVAGPYTSSQEESFAVATDCLAYFPSQSRAMGLTTIYLQGHQSNFYYCDQNRFSTRLIALYDHGLDSPLVNPTFVCFAASAMAMGSLFEHLHNTSANLEDGAAPAHTHEDTAMPGTKFLQLAQRLLPATLERRSVETVQSCLFIAFFLLATDDLESYYTYTGIALRVAVALSLHRLKKCKESNLGEASFEESKRVFWTVYCIER